MASQAIRLSKLFTPAYAARINAQLVYPAASQIVKPNELHSALCRPLHVARYEPDRPAAYFAATLSYGLIQGHPFFDGNKRTAFFLGNEYLRAQGHPSLTEEYQARVGRAEEAALIHLADRFIAVARGELSAEELLPGGLSAPPPSA